MAPRRSLAFDADLLRGTDDEDEEDAVPPPRRLSAKARGKRPAREVEADEDEADAAPSKRAYFAPIVVAEGAGRSSRHKAQPNGATTAATSGSGSASTSGGGRKAKPAAAVSANRQLARAPAVEKPMSRSLKSKKAQVVQPRVRRRAC